MSKILPYEDKIIKRKSKDENNRVVYESTCALCGQVVSYTHGEKPDVCPHCHQEDYIKPKTETRLFRLQDQWLATKDKEILGSMYVLMSEYTQSLIKKSLPNTFTYHYDLIEEKASDAVNLIIDYYISKPHFKIEKSFGGYINTKIREVLWNKKDQEEDNHESIYQSVNEDVEKEMLEVTDVLGLNSLFGNFEEYIQRERDKDYMLQGLQSIVKSMSDRIKDDHGYYYQIITLIGVKHFIINQSDMKKFYEIYKDETIKELIDKCMLIIYEFIKEH